ncbi:forkhead domain-containing protein, putative [Ixodes scapularis]|uniref:Forkhead domain-containing protein, putative n=1 Tax=Ixodes scapularis TaxID=6945 RepID=B7PF52_IXOSC|nr:forkhead domain-containing protein, putative [Ixodes scapularis]|eukprot:XP_002433824.1 forkhead domain-containing protein, putative [Ixodes scapularis]
MMAVVALLKTVLMSQYREDSLRGEGTWSKVHVNSKPPYSFSCLIFMAIEESAGKALPVKDIYAWILGHFPYFESAPTGWKNSVRHNLSLNKCFRK